MDKSPEGCSSISDVRDEIDRIDKQIIDLLGERLLYVIQIAKYKSSQDDIKAKKRYEEVLTLRKKWASEKNLSPTVIEEIYKLLMEYFIDEQMKILKLDAN